MKSLINTKQQFGIRWILIAVGLIIVRFLLAGDDFSYDYVNYITALKTLNGYEWDEIITLFWKSFPYVIIPGMGIFEIGFVLIAKSILTLFRDPAQAYALIAAFSIGVRIYAMRGLNVPWSWILVSQIYAITLFESNAIRTGVAVTSTIFGIYLLFEKRNRWAWALLLSAPFMHLQALIFLIPFVITWILRYKIATSRKVLFIAACTMTTGALIASSMITTYGLLKVSEYTGIKSASAGVNVTSVLAASYLCLALFVMPVRLTKLNCNRLDSRMLWLSANMALIPSVVLFIGGANTSALGDRAWQFSFVLLSSLLWIGWTSQWRRRITLSFISGIMLISLINVILRFPLSNFFDFILPHVLIVPFN